MGDVKSKIHNDTDSTVQLYVFNYADGLRSCARSKPRLAPGETREVTGITHPSKKLIVATDTGGSGHHMSCKHGQTHKVSDLLRCGGNPHFKGCATVAACVGTPIVWGIIGATATQTEKDRTHADRDQVAPSPVVYHVNGFPVLNHDDDFGDGGPESVGGNIAAAGASMWPRASFRD
eukprot:TRINITY_DN9627_c0_g1_i1.p1 TRINITY_DN9627_c0_g1~~TRINITY_DN9627_c0_g1_i1.p1  ORF type:complete len:177 (-),score=12.91 TRINITY_DN9627_c0_g1_i1:381-911(-)